MTKWLITHLLHYSLEGKPQQALENSNSFAVRDADWGTGWRQACLTRWKLQASIGMARSGALRACGRSIHFCRLRSSRQSLHQFNAVSFVIRDLVARLARTAQGDRGASHPCNRVWPILPSGRTTWKCLCRHHHGHRLCRSFGSCLDDPLSLLWCNSRHGLRWWGGGGGGG